MSFLTSILSKLFTTFLDWLQGKIVRALNYLKAKKQDDAKVDAPVEKIGSGDLKEGLDGTDDLENQFNSNA